MKNENKDNNSIITAARSECRGPTVYLSREEYRDKVEAYSQILKQQHLKTFASTEARKIANTGFLPKIDITAEGTANLNHLTNGTVRKVTTALIPIRHLQP